MIESTNYPYLPLRVHIDGFNADVIALVDTGFDGYLALPRSLASQLGMPPFSEPIGVASGDVFTVPAYLGTLELIGLAGEIPVTIILVGEETILGRGVLDRYVITLDRGQRIVVQE